MSERLPRTARLSDMHLLLNVADENLYSAEERIFVNKYRQKFQEYLDLQQKEQELRPNKFQPKLGFFASIKQKRLLEKIRICKNELTLMETDPPLMRVLERERLRDIQKMNEEHQRFFKANEQRKIQEKQAPKIRYQAECAKTKTATVVWRNVNGQIACPGDACPKECDNTCPIYINTQCLMLQRVGANDKALELYKKALEIAPDFYDAYNNMAGIYGGQGRYQEAYDHFLKAHELNPVRPNPIFGLALCCRDLNRPEECIKWCEEYNRRSTDNRLAEVYAQMKTKMDSKSEDAAEEESKDYEIVQTGEEWSIVSKDGCYFFVDEYDEYATTPRGAVLKTRYLALAQRILEDLDTYGPDDFCPDSILPWHYTMVENFSKMKHQQVEAVLADSFINRYDWTYTVNVVGTKWEVLWGQRGVREKEIADWLSKISHMQMTAACCIGNAYHTINIAYILATIMEKYNGEERDAWFEELADFVGEHSEFFASVDDFKTFELYYGIHLEEDGNVITG